jgi:hypothetical protein
VVREWHDEEGWGVLDSRAVRIWPAGTGPVDRPPSPPGEAYRSALVLTFEDEG